MSKIVKDSAQQISKPVKFKPRTRLLLQLGDQLIKNESIALVELVKNSYDADSQIVNIYMENVDDPENGIIIIEDDGYGMSPDTVENVWLEPGSDFKSKKMEANESSPKFNRLPIGEKGIGRFGVHKLGNIIEMTSKAEEANEVFVKIDWRDFEKHKYLEDVPISIIERPEPIVFKDGKTGTNISIQNLRENWTRGMARDVKRSITALASPFSKNDSFKPSFEVLDKPSWFDGLLKWEDVKYYSLFNFRVELKETKIISFNYQFTPWETMTKLFPRTVDDSNDLVSNFETLVYPKGFDEKEGNNINLESHKIGTVVFEGYIFDQDTFVLKLGVSDKSGFKKYLKENGGVRVFRDGLRVYDYGEPENDWLDLDHRRFQQPTKSISNNNILAAISLEREHSSGLVEKTNREGFVENDAYRAFRASVLHVIHLIETLRYPDKQRLRETYGPTPKTSPVKSTLAEAKSFVEENVNDAPVKKRILKYFNKIESDYKILSENLLKAAGAGLSMSVIVHEVEKIIFEVTKVLKRDNASERVLKLVEHLSSLIDGYAEIIRKSGKSSVSIIEIINQALFNTEYRLESHDILVVKSFKKYKGTTKINVPKNLLIGSLMNLIDNSIYWLDQKKVKSLEKEQQFTKKIFIDVIEDKNFIHLVICDNGTGFLIPTENITEPFVSAKPGGMGLGLHIAAEIMEAQKGRLYFPEKGDFDLPDEFSDGACVALSFKK